MESGDYEKQPFLVDEKQSHANSPTPERRSRSLGLGCVRLLTVYGASFLVALLVSRVFEVPFRTDVSKSCDTLEKGYTCRPEISQWWGQYSPYFSVPSDIPDELEDDCEITFAQILSRHGARDPTLKRTLLYAATMTKIKASTNQFNGKYAFLKHYKYKLGADQLNAFGKQELFNSGAKFYARYKKLSADILPFIRTSGQKRVVESAESWMKGYHHAKSKDKSAPKDDTYPYEMVTISEGPLFNNTLTHGLCTNIETGPMSAIVSDAKDAFINVFGPPILARLQKDLAMPTLEMDDMHNLMSMCPFDTIHTARGRISPFCDLFTEEEWQQYNHYESLDKFYGWGRGNPLGPTNGVGFTNELIARLTNSPVQDHTSTNHTLDDDPKTFPVDAKHTLFADFSHDNDLAAVFHAIGLYNSTPMLSITQVDSMEYTKGWSSSWAVPFSARAYFEKMKCKSSKSDEELVRVIVNDRVMPLETCGADDRGRCTLSAFVDSLSFARNGGHWDQCFWPVAGLDVQLPTGKVFDLHQWQLDHQR